MSHLEDCHSKCSLKAIEKVKCKADKCDDDNIRIFDHVIQLQVGDVFGLPVPGTQFFVTLTIRKEGPFVTIQLPAINFQTGQLANNPAEEGVPIIVPGGYVYTVGNHLPCNIRPNDIVTRTFFGPSNNGPNLAFSYSDTPQQLPVPITGYLLQFSNSGELTIQGVGTLGNIIPPGQQNLLPTTISYIVKPELKLEHNLALSNEFTNVSKFPPVILFPGTPYSVGLRDTTVNDAFGGIVAYAWADNSNVADQSQAVMNMAVAIGHVSKKGKLKIDYSQFLTNYIADSPDGSFPFDKAVAINKVYTNNIIVSWTNTYFPANNEPAVGSFNTKAVSIDGGQTWTVGTTGVPQPTGVPFATAGDNRGVASDKYGNIWWLSTNLFDLSGNFTNTPYFMVSTDLGATFNIVYTFPNPVTVSGVGFYDFPQYCFGGDGNGNYGINFVSDFFPTFNGGAGPYDSSPIVGFIQINGSANIPSNIIYPTFVPVLSQFLNNSFLSSITSSIDGRVWHHSIPEGTVQPYPGTGITNQQVVYKSPGPIDQNYAGPWDFATINLITFATFGPSGVPLEPRQYDAQPGDMFWPTAQTIIFDDQRKALYGIVNTNFPNYKHSVFAQNTNIYFAISRNNGQSWSNPIFINSTDKNNKGFPSMALDPVTRNLLFGWYDGRNDPTKTGVQYFGAVLDAKTLDCLVTQIPVSNPTYVIPAASLVKERSVKQLQTNQKTNQKTDQKTDQRAERVNVLKGRLGGLLAKLKK